MTAEDLEPRHARGIRNQVGRRDTNDALVRLEGSAFTEYVCECALKTCNGRLSLSTEEYEEVRRSSTQFVVIAGHTRLTDRLVRETDRYSVIEKSGEEAKLATRLSRRHA